MVNNKGRERRKRVRVATQLKLRTINKDNVVQNTITKDISPIGLRFETTDEKININDEVELKIEMPGGLSPVNAKAKVVWKKKLQDKKGAASDIGCKFTQIEEDNKNTFLKFLFDLLHSGETSEKGEE